VTARRAKRNGVRVLGISLLIFGVIHVPLPQADYHNIRHHDGPGEVCVYHDHLLRWHPTASSNEDVSLLHWHWFVPPGELGDLSHPAGDASPGRASGPAVHAHLPNCLVPTWPGDLVSRLDTRSGIVDGLTLALSASSSILLGNELGLVGSSPGRYRAAGLDEGAGLRAQRIAMFQRWNC
jgi:hypothetical protein